MGKDPRGRSIFGSGIMTAITKAALIFGMTFIIMAVALIAYFFGGLSKTARYEMRQKYIRKLGGKNNNIQGESLRQNFLQEGDNNDNI